MELMASCFDKLLKLIQQPFPESVLGKLTFAVGVKELKMHVNRFSHS
jgi:mitogen-activated protein kinase kinase 7